MCDLTIIYSWISCPACADRQTDRETDRQNEVHKSVRISYFSIVCVNHIALKLSSLFQLHNLHWIWIIQWQ